MVSIQPDSSMTGNCKNGKGGRQHRLSLGSILLTPGRPVNLVIVGKGGIQDHSPGWVKCTPVVVFSFPFRGGAWGQGSESQRSLGWSGSSWNGTIPGVVRIGGLLIPHQGGLGLSACPSSTKVQIIIRLGWSEGCGYQARLQVLL